MKDNGQERVVINMICPETSYMLVSDCGRVAIMTSSYPMIEMYCIDHGFTKNAEDTYTKEGITYRVSASGKKENKA